MKKNINKLSIIIFIISIITIILSFFLYLYIIPISIIGVIISIFLRKKSKLYYLIISIYLISIILSIILYIFYKPKPLNDIVGSWNCAYYDKLDYIVELKINQEKLFLWSKYSDKKNNYILGTYKLNKLNKKDQDKNVLYYNLILDSNKYIQNNKKLKDNYHEEYEVAINKKEEKIVLINKNKMILKCNKINSNNPIIEK